MKRFVIYLLFLLITFTSEAKVILPSIVADGMVLQQKTEATLWGKADPDSKIVITTTWSNDKVTVRADEDGHWLVRVATPQAGGPYEITFNDGDRVTLKNVLIGEVWICSGQSNMNMRMKGAENQPVAGAAELIMGAHPSTLIRSCNLDHVKAFEPQEECNAKWSENTPEGVADASAVAYFFAKRLYDILGVPIGIIHASWGHTPIEAWMSPQILADEFASEFDLSHLETKTWREKRPFQMPGVLYNGMLYSLRNYTAKGFIWYQGCSNRKNPDLYKRLQPAFVRMLRNDWNNERMPFYYTQIAPYRTNPPEFMWAQAQNLADIPYSGMASTHDVGEYDVIHPAKKQPVGDRLAYLALSKDYGMDYIDADTPVPVLFEFKGGEAIVTFNSMKMGLSPSSQDLDGFELAGEDGVFYAAKGRVVGGNMLKVYKCPQVQKAVAVRYAMSPWCPSTLFNCYGIPATPFASDK